MLNAPTNQGQSILLRFADLRLDHLPKRGLGVVLVIVAPLAHGQTALVHRSLLHLLREEIVLRLVGILVASCASGGPSKPVLSRIEPLLVGGTVRVVLVQQHDAAVLLGGDRLVLGNERLLLIRRSCDGACVESDEACHGDCVVGVWVCDTPQKKCGGSSEGIQKFVPFFFLLL